PTVIHMFVKIFCVGLRVLTQFLFVFFVSFSFIKYKITTSVEVSETLDMIGISSAPISIYVYALLFFVLGYLLYATIAAMLGSLVSRVEDVQQDRKSVV